MMSYSINTTLILTQLKQNEKSSNTLPYNISKDCEKDSEEHFYIKYIFSVGLKSIPGASCYEERLGAFVAPNIFVTHIYTPTLVLCR